MFANGQFHIFGQDNNFSSDQLDEISEAVNTRSLILNNAMDNLGQAMKYMDSRPDDKLPAKPKQVVIKKKTNTAPSKTTNQKALKGKVSYKVKGPDGRPMNIAEIKGWINSIYDGNQGIIKQ